MSEKKNPNRPLADGYSFKLIFAFFLVGSLLGTYWEEILYFVRFQQWVCRDGTVIGPFSPIYGVGVCIFAAILGKGNAKRPIWKTFLYSALIGGVTEFMMSVVAEYIFHQVIWDYSGKFLNIMGRTTVPFMLGWGLGGTVLMKLIYPLFEKLLRKIPYRFGQPVYILLLVFMAVNLFLTYGSMGRQSIRATGQPPATFIGEFFDNVFTDEWLQERFPAIDFTTEGHTAEAHPEGPEATATPEVTGVPAQ